MAFDQNKPAQNGSLVSSDIRNNFVHLKNAMTVEHVWDDNNPGNTKHRLDQIKTSVTGSTQREFVGVASSSNGYDSVTGSGNVTGYYDHVTEGVPANTYTLQSLLQELVNRSHRHKVELRYSNCNCNCNCDCGGGQSCFIAGTLILMADFSWKPVEQLDSGDKVRGLTGVNTVIAPYKNVLGSRRSIMTFTDRSLSWSGEHLLWVRTDNDEFFGTCDFNHHLREKDAARFPEFKGYTLSEREAIIICKPVEFAHLTGWKMDEPVVAREYGDATHVYTAILDGDHTMIANGYVAGGFVHDDDVDYSKIHWNGLAGL